MIKKILLTVIMMLTSSQGLAASKYYQITGEVLVPTGAVDEIAEDIFFKYTQNGTFDQVLRQVKRADANWDNVISTSEQDNLSWIMSDYPQLFGTPFKKAETQNKNIDDGPITDRWWSNLEHVVLDWFWISFFAAISIFIVMFNLIGGRDSRLKAAAVRKIRLEKERAKLAEERKIRLEKEKARLKKEEERVRLEEEGVRLEEERVRLEEERVRLEEERVRIEQQKLDKFLIGLHHSLPFYTRNDSQKYSQSNGDDFRWNNALNAIKSDDTTETSLYLVKVKDLDVGDEHHKIGTTTQEVSKRFLKSPDLELLEIVYEFKMEARLALFAEFHFIREFRPTDNPEGIEKSSVMLDDTPKEFQKRFSGYTEVVKDTSVKKILTLMRNLPEYVAKADDLLTKKLTQE